MTLNWQKWDGEWRVVSTPFGPALEVLTEMSIAKPSIAYVGPHIVDIDKQIVSTGNVVMKLTPKEWGLLKYMAQHLGSFVSNRELLVNVWGYEYANDDQFIRVWVTRLRKKVGKEFIENNNGVGYRLIGRYEQPDSN